MIVNKFVITDVNVETIWPEVQLFISYETYKVVRRHEFSVVNFCENSASIEEVSS